jgi:ankyrin repeat protein
MSETTKPTEPTLSFNAAIAAMDRGDIDGLKALLAAHPSLITETAKHDDSNPIDYFTGATLLHHIAGNPNRGNLPKSIVQSAALLLEAGADPNARTVRGSTTIGLILTSKDASEAGVALDLINLLKAAGATDDLDNEETLLLPLRNCAYATAQSLCEAGYKTGLRSAAGLGLTGLVREYLEDGFDQDELNQALTYAVRHSHPEIADLLLEHGAKIDSIPDVYGNPGTALHIAPTVAMARFLIERGADTSIKDPTFNGTPADWSNHSNNPELIEFFQSLA